MKACADLFAEVLVGKVLSMYQDEMEWSDSKGRFPEVCIVDFQTNELYTLGKSHTGYWIRDYWIHIY